MKWILFELKDSLLFKNGPIFVRLAFLLNFDLIFIGIVNYDDAKILQILCLKIFNPGYGNRGCRVFKGGGDTKLERFLPKNTKEIIEF